MPKTYRVRIDRALGGPPSDAPIVYDPLIDVTDTGYYLSPLLKSWAKRIHEPAPVVNFEGQEVMNL